ncbi:hypothetical protein M5689_010692 [Euphorbia peplus]|nr:hypothetical protein M5689_010692 [Euphorbia peplus]
MGFGKSCCFLVHNFTSSSSFSSGYSDFVLNLNSFPLSTSSSSTSSSSSSPSSSPSCFFSLCFRSGFDSMDSSIILAAAAAAATCTTKLTTDSFVFL